MNSNSTRIVDFVINSNPKNQEENTVSYNSQIVQVN